MYADIIPLRALSCTSEGQLGDGSFADKEKTSVEIPDDVIIYGLGSGASSQSVFFIAKDTVYAAGTNDRYQLGIGEVGSKADPVEVKFDIFTNMDIVKISSSGSHTVAIGEYPGYYSTAFICMRLGVVFSHILPCIFHLFIRVQH